MNRSTSLQRLMLIAILAFAAVTTQTPAAHAGNAWGHVRYKGVDRSWRTARDERGPVVIRESGAGPAIAGLVGGFLLGQAFGHGHVDHVMVHDCPPPPRYRYYDPYDDEYYSSLDDCPSGYRAHHRARFVRVIEISSGRCVGAMQWCDGDWRNCDDRDFSRLQDRDRGRWSHRDDDDEDDGR
jgi:hypothetical protein